MTGETHRSGGVLCTLVGFMILKQKGLLLPNINEFLQLAVIYPYASWGSVASDLDHEWNNCPNKSLPNRLVNLALHITTPTYRKLDKLLNEHEKKNSTTYKVNKFFSANHRSWQTHSDITLCLVVYLLLKVLHSPMTGNTIIFSLVFMGVGLGITAHFILDMLTPLGIWFTLGKLVNKIAKKHILPEKIRLVPSSSFFATDGPWEKIIQKVIKILTAIVFVIFVLSYFYPNLLSDFPYFTFSFGN